MARQYLDKSIDLPGLAEDIRKARMALRHPRQERAKIARTAVGTHWSEEGAKQEQPINLLGLFDRIVVPKLCPKNPRVLISTFHQEDKPTIAAMQDWANPEIERIRFDESIQRCAQDAFTFVGIMKVALATPADSAMTAWNRPAGSPFAEPIDLDDWVHDIHARKHEGFTFMGHRYRAPIDAIKDSKIYSRGRRNLAPSPDPYYNLEGDERISAIGRTYMSGEWEGFEPHVDLWEIYLPRHRLVLTLAHDQLTGVSGDDEPLRVQKWIGPDSGPYHFLGFGMVPGNALPKGPILDLVDLHNFCNTIWRKLQRQSTNQKTNTYIPGVASEDGSHIQKANDLDIVKVDNPQLITQVEQGGPNQKNVAIFMQAMQLFSQQAGNLEIIGGLGAQSKTATQDEMLEQNASGIMQAMQDATLKHVASTVKGLLWYWHHDPYGVMKTQKTLPGTNLSLSRQVTPEQRQQVPFESMDIRVDPYSMQAQTPQSRLKTLNETVTAIVLPMMQLLQQQGVSFDIQKYLEKVGNYSDDPDLAEILTIVEPILEEAQGGGDQPKMPSSTTRTYERVNRPGRTDQQGTQNTVASLMGADLGGQSNGVQRMGAA